MEKKILLPVAVLIALVLGFFVLKPILNEAEPLDQQSARETINLRFGHNTPVDSALHEAAVRYARLVDQRTGGQVKIEIFPAQQLGNDHEMVEMAREGKLDLLLTPTAKMSVPVPAMQYADLPFLFPSREDAYEMLDGEPGRMLLQRMRPIGLIGLTFWENGFKHFTGNVAFTDPEAFSGKKIRVMKSRIIMSQFESVGAEPVPIDFHTTRQALADGVVDGQENPLIAIYSMGFHEVQSDLVISEHAYLAYVFSISEKTFNNLPPEIGSLLVDIANEVTPWERQETQKREKVLLDKIRQSGVKVHYLTEEQRKAFTDQTAHIVKAFEHIIGTDIISKTEELLEEKYGPQPSAREQVVIGINADLSVDGGGSGLAIKRGVELAIKDLNAKGGLLGKPVKLITKNHFVNPDTGKSNLDNFAQRQDLVAVIGGKHGAVIHDEMPHVQKLEMPYLIPWSATKKITATVEDHNFIFRLSANDLYVAEFLVNEVVKSFRKPLIVVENSVWGRSNLEQMTEFLSKKGINQAIGMVINRGQEDFEEEFNQLSSQPPDSIIMVLNPKEGSRVIKLLSRLDNIPPVISHWGIVGGTCLQENRETIKEMDLRIFQTFSFIGNERPQAQKLASLYQETYGGDGMESIRAPSAVAQAYDLTNLLAIAVEQAGSFDRSDIRKALENIPLYDGVVKSYEMPFSPSDHDALDSSDFILTRYNSDGYLLPL